jgi:AcrR family transcriptional regulator
MTPTQDRILDAAERLFADRGFAATSMRSITSEADVNLAAVNYHFGSKEALLQAVFDRRLADLNRERIERLDAIETEAGEARLELEPVVRAFLEPALRMARDPDCEVFMRLVGHMFHEPSPAIQQMFHKQFREVGRRFHGALRRTLPRLEADEVFWRLVFMVGTMAHTLSMTKLLPLLYAQHVDARRPFTLDGVEERMTRFVVAGLRDETEPGR